ncbi:MAG: Ger(x)C family spore germination protein [Bacillota bacterium]
MKKTFSITFFIILLLSGCMREKNIDEIKLIDTIGYDIEGDQILGSGAFHVYQKIPENSPMYLFTGRSDSINGIFKEFTSHSHIPIEIGQTRAIVISEDFAKNGISDLVETLVRDPIISNNAKIIISRQNASELLTLTMKYPPYFFSDIIENNMEKGNFPLSNIHYVISQFYGEGQDIYLPLIKIESGELLMMDGLGIFSGGKLAMQLNKEDTLLFKLIKDKIVSGNYEINEETKIFFKILDGKNKITIKGKNNTQTAVFNLQLKIMVKDYPSDFDLSKKEDVESISDLIETHFSTNIERLLAHFQENKVDPVGLGEIFRENQRDWDEKTFYTIYPSIPIEVKVNVKLMQSGVGN